MMVLWSALWILCCLQVAAAAADIQCDELQQGQFKCDEPEIDAETQRASECKKDRKVPVSCRPAPGITCSGEDHFQKSVPCRYTNGYSYSTSLLLSIFLGMFGLDRMYLGYPAIGLLKFCTMGLCFVGQFLDVILIATQVVGPADGSDYVIDYYGPILIQNALNNDTYYVPQDKYHL